MVWTRIYMAKAAINKKTLFTSKKDLNVREKTSKALELKLGHLGNYIRNTWEVLKYGAGEGRSIIPIM